MPFQDSAESLRAKLHLGKASIPVVVGVAVVIVIAVGVAAAMLLGGLSSDSFQLRVDDEGASVKVDGLDGASRSEGAESATQESAATIAVHVSGAVVLPGVYELPEGSRVDDAVAAAGGTTEGAAADALNLARALSDGEQIIVPTVEEQKAQQQSAASGQGASGGAGGKVNINVASVEQLDTLPGVGEATAQKIIADREENGPFSSPEDLKRVSGIGDKKYAELADLITVG